MFETVVPRSVRLAEAPSHGLPICRYDSGSPGADAYYRVAHRPAATFTSCGPGSVNLAIALACAMMDSSALVAITGNVIRKAFVGVGVSVMPGAGTALVNNNMISETPRGAVVGLDHARTITTDLSAEGAQRYAQVVVGGNAVRR